MKMKVVQGVNKEVYAFDSIGVRSSFNQFETLKALNFKYLSKE